MKQQTHGDFVISTNNAWIWMNFNKSYKGKHPSIHPSIFYDFLLRWGPWGVMEPVLAAFGERRSYPLDKLRVYSQFGVLNSHVCPWNVRGTQVTWQSPGEKDDGKAQESNPLPSRDEVPVASTTPHMFQVFVCIRTYKSAVLELAIQWR